MCLFGFHSRHFHTYNVLFHILFTMVCFLCVKTCSSLNMRNQNPKLTKVSSGLPTNIIKLDLAFNEISELGADNFTGMTSMEELNLEANVIAHIDDLAFLSCLSLTNLNLRNNKIVHMHATLGPNSHNMIKFRIRGNPCIIEFPWLQQLRSIQVIQMEGFGMDPHNDMFSGLLNLKQLGIENSKAPNLTERTTDLEQLMSNYHIGNSLPEENFINLNKLILVRMTGVTAWPPCHALLGLQHWKRLILLTSNLRVCLI